MNARIFKILSLALVAASTPTLAFAHTGVGATGGLAHGFFHPFSGLDHTVAMVMVGLIAARLGGRALWLLPTTFLALMAVGGALGVAGVAVPHVEVGIAVSLIAFGAVAAAGVRAPAAMAFGLVGFFAIFHGHAHGTEMPMNASGFSYGAGFLVATALLHAMGLGLGLSIETFAKTHGALISRVTGGLAAAAGFGMLGGVL